MGTTTRAPVPVAERLRRIFVACSVHTGPRTVTLKIFDKHALISEMMPSADMVTGMQDFLNALTTLPGLPATVVTNLSSIQFTVTYAARRPDRGEIERFAVTDFPIYLLTATGQVAFSAQDVVDLLVSHQIPEETNVVAALSPFRLAPVFPYQTVEKDWQNDPTVLGMGIPGRYFIPNSQTRCRKVALIKMQGFMTENLPAARRPEKMLSVLRHELGHMFGLRHQDGTIMNDKYNLNVATRFTNEQTEIISRALDALLQ